MFYPRKQVSAYAVITKTVYAKHVSFFNFHRHRLSTLLPVKYISLFLVQNQIRPFTVWIIKKSILSNALS